MKKITTKKVVAVAVAATLAFGSLASAMVGRSGDKGELLVDLESDLLMHYTFDDTIANKVTNVDAIASARVTPAYVEGHNGKALDFKAIDASDGTAGTLQSTEYIPEGSKKVTFNCWQKVPANASASSALFVDTNCSYLQIGAAATWPIVRISSDSAHTTTSHTWGTAKDKEAAYGLAQPTEWAMLTVVLEDGAVTVYKDGQKIAYNGDVDTTTMALKDDGSDFFSNLLVDTVNNYSWSRVTMGGGDWWMDNNKPQDQKGNYNGLLDDVLVYTRALSATEVAALYENNGVPANQYADPTPTPTVAPGGDEDPSTEPENPSTSPENPSTNPSTDPSDEPVVLPTGSVEELTGTKWWDGMQVGKDYALNGDGSIELFVEVKEAGAFSVELVSAEADGSKKYFLTTGSDKNAWTAEGAQGIGTVSGVPATLSSDIVAGHIYKITVTRKGQDITVAYYDATAKTEYCTLKWTGGNMKENINVHVMAQVGKYKVYSDAKAADPLPTAKPSEDPSGKPSTQPSGKPSTQPSGKPSDSGKPGVPNGVTGKVTKVTVKAAGKKAGKTIYVKKGDKVTLKATVTGTGTYTKGVTYKSSKKKVATVSSKGVIKAKKAGTAKITVTSKFDKTKKATITVKVSKKKVANKKLKLKVTKKTLKKGKTYTVAIKSITKKTTDKVTYKTSKKKVATVDKYGVVKAKKKGKAKITVKCGKKKATLTVTVK